jgi:hypothetical protein
VLIGDVTNSLEGQTWRSVADPSLFEIGWVNAAELLGTFPVEVEKVALNVQEEVFGADILG